MTRRSSRSAPRWTLVEGGAEGKDENAFVYSAWFAEELQPEDVLVQRITAFAEKQNVRLTLVHSGVPFLGVACHVALDPLTAEAILVFCAEFAPKLDCAIPYL
jgi:hypothetical protein